MVCKKCKENPVFELPNSGVKLCKNCFIKYFEKKALKTISQFKMLQKGDVVGIGVSGGKDSMSVLHILNNLAVNKRLITIKVISIDEGIEGYRDLSNVHKFCNENGIEVHEYSFKEEFGIGLDKIMDKFDLKPCSVCGVLRRFLLNSKARDLGVNKLATGHNLDDEAQSVVMNEFRGHVEQSARLGPVTGVVDDPRFIKRIKPFYLLTEKEVGAYSFLKKFPVDYNECPYSVDSYRGDVRDILNSFVVKHPHTKHAIIKSFLEVLPDLKNKYKGSKIKGCKNCDEPCSGDVCKVCEFLEKLGLKKKKKK